LTDSTGSQLRDAGQGPRHAADSHVHGQREEEPCNWTPERDCCRNPTPHPPLRTQTRRPGGTQTIPPAAGLQRGAL